MGRWPGEKELASTSNSTAGELLGALKGAAAGYLLGLVLMIIIISSFSSNGEVPPGFLSTGPRHDVAGLLEATPQPFPNGEAA